MEEGAAWRGIKNVGAKVNEGLLGVSVRNRITSLRPGTPAQ